MQIIENKKQYDVVIVGSGAGGGMATKILAEQGLKVAVVEAGPFFDPANPDQQTQLKWPYESPRRGAGTTRAFGEFDMAYGGWNIEGEPYNQIGDTNLIGSAPGCWGEEPTIGEEFHFALDLEILKEKIEMAWAITGR